MLSQWALKDGFSIIACRHICKVKLPISLLVDYLNCIRNQDCDDMDLIKSKMNFVKYSTFPYGVDEYFLNYIMLSYMKKQNMLYSVTVRYNIVAPFYYFSLRKLPYHSPGGKLLLKMLKNIMDKQNSKDTEYKYLFKEFDDKMYIEPNTNLDEIKLIDEQKEIAKRFYKEIYKLWKNKDYSLMAKITLKKILNNKRGNYLVKNNIYVYRGYNLEKKYLIDKL